MTQEEYELLDHRHFYDDEAETETGEVKHITELRSGPTREHSRACQHQRADYEDHNQYRRDHEQQEKDERAEVSLVPLADSPQRLAQVGNPDRIEEERIIIVRRLDICLERFPHLRRVRSFDEVCEEVIRPPSGGVQGLEPLLGRRGLQPAQFLIREFAFLE